MYHVYQAQGIPDNLMEGNDKIRHSTSGVYCALKLFGKAKSCYGPLPTLHLS